MKLAYYLIIFLCMVCLLATSLISRCYASLSDLNYIYMQIIENHPGIYNKFDPQFRQKLYKEYSAANKLLNKTTDPNQQKFIITSFIKSFDDAHLRVSWHNDKQFSEHNVSNKKNSTFNYRNITSKVVWIGLPTFSISNSQKSQFELIKKKISNLYHKDIIIFDLRNNKGGNSNYGTQIINQIFGKSCAEQGKKQLYSNVYIDWRVSIGNLEHIKFLYEVSQLEWMKNIISGMQNSLLINQNYYRETFGLKPNNFSVKCKNIKTKIIVIIDCSNMSAALGFIDELKTISKSIYLLGEKTNADRLYIEVRSQKLPSGDGDFFFPIKVYRLFDSLR